MAADVPNRSHLTRFAWLSIAAAAATIAIKAGAWWLTGSVGLLSDAFESIVNLVAAAMALWMLRCRRVRRPRSMPTATRKPSISRAA